MTHPTKDSMPQRLMIPAEYQPRALELAQALARAKTVARCRRARLHRAEGSGCEAEALAVLQNCFIAEQQEMTAKRALWSYLGELMPEVNMGDHYVLCDGAQYVERVQTPPFAFAVPGMMP